MNSYYSSVAHRGVNVNVSIGFLSLFLFVCLFFFYFVCKRTRCSVTHSVPDSLVTRSRTSACNLGKTSCSQSQSCNKHVLVLVVKCSSYMRL